jgi:Carboxypeptidase regulatory-like domain
MRRRASFVVLFAAILALTGCGGSLSKVNGVVKLDGVPVEGATVTFTSEDGKAAYAGFSDASGNFTLAAGEKQGVPAGTYKVVVVKSPKSDVAGDMTPGSKDYLKMMEKKGNAGVVKGPAAMMPGAKAAKAGGASELPSIYASASTTPITVKIPPETQPVPIELKSKP